MSEQWNRIQLGKACEIILGQSPSSNTYNQDKIGLPFFQGKSEFGSKYAQAKTWCSDPIKIAKKNDILISVRAPVGEANLAPDICCIGRGLAALRADQENLLQEFLWHQIEFKKVYLQGISQGSTFDAISGKDLSELQIELPPLPEQKKIAEILSGIDRVLASSKRRIKCLKLLKKALVSRHIENAENAIEESKLDDILVSMDSGWSPNCLKRPPLNTNEWSILKTTSVTWKGFNQEERKALPSNLVPKQELVVEKGDILVTRAGPADRTGVAAYVDKRADNTMISDKIIRLRCDRNRIDPRFLSIFLSTDCAQRQILKGKAGMASSQTNISQQLLKDMTVRFPQLPEQRHVSEIVAELQGFINQVEAYMERTEKLKTSLSADLLSGRKRVTL
jgi:type I restriction enzyme S subunit